MNRTIRTVALAATLLVILASVGPAHGGAVTNAGAIAALWEKARETAGDREVWRVREAVACVLEEKGDAVFPVFAPDGNALAFQLVVAGGAQRARMIRLMSPETLRSKNHLIAVRSPSGGRTAIPGLRSGARSADAQVYFHWTGPKRFAYFSRNSAAVCQAEWPKSGDAAARQLLRCEAITMAASGESGYCQETGGLRNLRGDAFLVEVHRTRDSDKGALISLATMPAICPRNSRTVAFVGRARGSGSTDIYVRFAGGHIARLETAEAWEKLPVWSPDGKCLAFYSTRTNVRRNEYGIWAVKVDHARRNLGAMFSVSGSDLISAQDLRDTKRHGGPAWSPDSRQILYFAKRYKSDAGVEGDLYQFKTYDLRYGIDEGAFPVPLPQGARLNSPGDITCSPAGGLIAFSNAVNSDGKRSFVLVFLLTDMGGRKAE